MRPGIWNTSSFLNSLLSINPYPLFSKACDGSDAWVFIRRCYALDEFVASVITAWVVWWIGTGEGLAGRHTGAALARIPDCARVPAARPSASSVVEAVSFAREVVAARSAHNKKNEN